MDKLIQHVPALIVIAPLIGGLLSALVGRKGLGWVFAMTTSLISLAGSLFLLNEVVWGDNIQVLYRMGNWPQEFGILYLVDPLNAAVLTIVSFIGTLCTFYARKSTPSEIPAKSLHFFYAVWQFCLTGLLGITITGDAFNLYVLLEISSLATYTLVAMGRGRNRRALTASINYLVLGTIGASFILLGIGYLYMVTGTLNMAEMATELNRIQATWATDAPEFHNATIAGFAFLIVGLSLKLALFPLHTWLPNAYTYSPSAVSALLAATATKV
ncbi:proton-conducting transporter membrane subunit, partial [Planctomycetota bacterium]|nr:proton-conducting transporter membrane subunit [Planctomycetota bacterium]